MTAERIRVAIVDDHPLFREGVAHTLAADPAIEVVGEGGTADEAIRLAAELLPDVLLLDVALPGGGLAATAAVARACPVTAVLMLTVSEQEDDVLAAFKAGARGYVLKGVAGRELAAIVRAAHAGEVHVTPALAAGLLAELAGGPPPAPPAAVDPRDELTGRERQILELVASGLSNKEIGHALHLTEKTVKHYMTNIFQKLQVRNRVEAALLAHGAGRAEPRP